MISICRALLRGEALEHGRPLRRPRRLPPPGALARSAHLGPGRGPRMLDLGGRAADGVLALVGTCDECIASMIGEVAEAADNVGPPDAGDRADGIRRHRGRRRGGLEGVALDGGLVRQDRAPVLRPGRYRPRAGRPDPRSLLRRGVHRGHHRRRARAREMVEKLTLSGAPAEVRDRLDRLERAGIRHVNYCPIGPNRLSSFLASRSSARRRRPPPRRLDPAPGTGRARPRGVPCRVWPRVQIAP